MLLTVAAVSLVAASGTWSPATILGASKLHGASQPQGTNQRQASSQADVTGSSHTLNSAEGISLTLESQHGGAVRAVALDDDTAYVGMGQRLVVVDLSDAAEPALLGRTQLLSGMVTGVSVDGGLAYAWGRIGSDAPLESGDRPGATALDATPDGVRLVDIRDRAAPRTRGFFASPQPVQGVAVIGGHLFVAAGTSGLRVVDVADPDMPTEVGAVEDATILTNARDVAAWRSHVMVADEEGARLVVFDVASPAEPRVVGSLATAGQPRALDLTPLHAYVSVIAGDTRPGLDGLAVVDISDPETLSAVGWIDLPRPADVAVAANRARVITSVRGCGPPLVATVDIAQPSAPVIVPGASFVARSAQAVQANDELLLIAQGDRGLDVFPTEATQLEDRLSRVGMAGFAVGLSATDGDSYAHVVNYASDALDTIDSHATDAIVPAVRWDEWPWSTATLADVQVNGDHTFVAYGQNCDNMFAGMYVLEDTTDQTMNLIADIDLGVDYEDGRNRGSSSAIEIAGRYAYVSDEFGWLSVIDVSDPLTPTRTGIVDFGLSSGATAHDLAVGTTHVFVATYRHRVGSSVAVVDVTDPESPHVVTWLPTPNIVASVAVDGSHLFAAVTDYGVMAWDVSTPEKPAYLGANTSLNTMSVEAQSNRVFVVAYPPAEDGSGDIPLARWLWILDGADPLHLPELGRMRLLDPLAIEVLGDEILVASGNAGLVRLRMKPSGGPVPTATAGATRTPRVTNTPAAPSPATPTPRPSSVAPVTGRQAVVPYAAR